METSQKSELTLNPSELNTITDAIEDALRELDEEPLNELISQGVVDKLVTSLEILKNGQ